MKKTILTMTLSLFTIIMAANNLTPIDKLFEFKLGMSLQDLKQIVDTTQLSEVNVEGNEPFAVIAVVEELESKIEVYHLTQYHINSSLSLEEVYFYFFKNKLFELQVKEYNPKVEDLLTKKYGDPGLRIDDVWTWRTWGKNYKNDNSSIFSTHSEDFYRLVLTDYKTSDIIGEEVMDEYTKRLIEDIQVES